MKHPERPISRTLGVAAAGLIAAGVAASLGDTPAGAATASNYIWVNWGDDYLRNYDNLSTSAASNNVDWPVTIAFTNNATVDKAKSSMESWSENFDDMSTTPMYMQMTDDGTSGGIRWDQDRGKKVPMCPATGLSSPHYRVYGIGDSERLYNSTVGYWVPATTHRDYNECPPINTHYDDTEAVEQLIADDAADNTTVERNRWFFFNAEPYRAEGNHVWDSNGYVTTVRIP